jgi:outer membrane protein TolC
MALRRQQLLAEINLADNGLAPKVNLFGLASQDMGSHPNPDILPTKQPFELRAGLSFEWTLQRRSEQGKLDALEAELAKLDADIQWTQEQIAVEVRSTFTAIQAAHDQYTIAQQLSQNAQTLLDAELKRFSLGDSNLFTIYLREQSVISARQSELDAWFKYQAAIALHIAAAALDLPPF